MERNSKSGRGGMTGRRRRRGENPFSDVWWEKEPTPAYGHPSQEGMCVTPLLFVPRSGGVGSSLMGEESGPAGFYALSSGTIPIKSITTLQPGTSRGPGTRTVVLAGGSFGKDSAHVTNEVKNSPKSV